MSMEEKYTYEQIKDIADSILARTDQRPKLGIICGSGLGGLADLLASSEVMAYSSIPGFPMSTVKGHAGMLVFGKLEEVQCVCMKGRFHYYEGYPMWKTAAPVQIMFLMGVRALIVTNAAGGLNPRFSAGDMMVITDHINLVGLCGNHPLMGPNDDRLGPRFPQSNKIYSTELQEIFKRAADSLGLLHHVKEGTYIFAAGPSFESTAEVKWFKSMGGDAVGMSTIPETVTASHCGITVLGISLITNQCIDDIKSAATPSSDHDEVLEIAKKRVEELQDVIKLTVREGQHVWTQGI